MQDMPKHHDPSPDARMLVLMRHAEAFHAPHGDLGRASDLSRPLTPSGRRRAGQRGTQLREIGFHPDLVLVSPAIRSSETYTALGPFPAAPAPTVVQEAGLYESGPDTLLDIIRLTPDIFNNIIVIGHNPDLYHLVLDLAGRAIDDPDKSILSRGFPTASLACFRIDGPWHELTARRAVLSLVLCA
ncbi:phosphoglycerate mutase [Gluconacetobacter azotocaptans]|uniref:Phosphoglycerate mutase n=2 Tax=Gluconacetobacter azotocaptans TaxID=142834 RepID=A0A7W4PEG5_9PROT|nr:phosphoglycerate mutase [Gluconacetobacter azotocaptans]MBM9400881.1 histidine phosphatase family protein [Gluconacetobacter azotocaptans]GBQ30507.1 phosphohistidine phosphatase SixA [Gluconacetobacter azotocaptans DSM 13594]